ncbi:hypothetical protein ACTPOK_30255 [Streptomyces inhibens]|uniref:hypothetical protein n=1 Tax=Streptomyces inhibens TaxID=2293571 RepID=UPI00402A6970
MTPRQRRITTYWTCLAALVFVLAVGILGGGQPRHVVCPERVRPEAMACVIPPEQGGHLGYAATTHHACTGSES